MAGNHTDFYINLTNNNVVVLHPKFDNEKILRWNSLFVFQGSCFATSVIKFSILNDCLIKICCIFLGFHLNTIRLVAFCRKITAHERCIVGLLPCSRTCELWVGSEPTTLRQEMAIGLHHMCINAATANTKVIVLSAHGSC